jgi:hypothetical protein
VFGVKLVFYLRKAWAIGLAWLGLAVIMGLVPKCQIFLVFYATAVSLA